MLDDEVERLIAGILEATANLVRGAFNEYNARIAALESELAALRQIVADVETCQRWRGKPGLSSVEIFTDLDSKAKDLRASARVQSTLLDSGYFHAETWQAALHAAAEHVRNTNPERTGHEV